MDAFPMIARCMERQWAGYSPGERWTMTEAWRSGHVLLVVGFEAEPIWPVWHGPGNHLVLMGIK